MANKGPLNEDKEESKIDTMDDSGKMIQKGKENGCEEDSVSNSLLEKRSHKSMRDGLGRFKSKRKRHKGSNRDNTNESPSQIMRRRLLENVSHCKEAASCCGIGNPAMVCELKQLLVVNDPEVIFLCETKFHTNKFVSIHSKCRMEGCLAVNAIGKSGGLVMMWKEGIKVELKKYSDHIDYLIHLDNNKFIRFTGFYGNVDPNKRQSSWDMFRKVEKPVKEKWIIGGDFNAILDNVEK
ncbi:hypothetical protein Goshw_023077 [Gossypium schwendimanii]|uniref:Endonuclease/exonuclease/phosphatase domain-containing protein n=1 Tax=Gossypium schwendimanii TaxID=34291 RepID=A0A7J9MJD0_GOSSC|nr:hypothetical protein [Gossypium schwendimanii]